MEVTEIILHRHPTRLENSSIFEPVSVDSYFEFTVLRINFMKPRRKVLWFVAVSFGLLVVLCALPFINMRWNDGRLNRFAAQLEKSGHPPGTRLIKSVRFLGITHGTGNQCDFLVAELRSYKDSAKELKAYYRARRAKAPDGEVIPVGVTVWDGSRFDDDSFFRMNDINSWFAPHLLKEQRLYVVYINAGGYEPCLDIRCH